MAVQIPEQHKRIIAQIATLPDNAIGKLEEALKAAKPEISPAALAKQLGGSTGISRSELTALIGVLLSLTITRRARHLSIDEITRDIVDAAQRGGLGDLKPGTPSLEALQDRLKRLLAVGAALDVTGRAADVYFAHDTLFRSARILSDIRPIFGSGELARPLAGMIVHNLELTLHKDSESRLQFVAMNIHDLRELKRVIDRAIKKNAILRDLVSSCEMMYVEDVPNEHQR